MRPRLREFLTALRHVVETGGAAFNGELLTATTPLPATAPGAEPPVPVLVAAMAPQTPRVSGELADGILPLPTGPRPPPAHRADRHRHGRVRGPPAPQTAVFVPGVVNADGEAVQRTGAETLAFYEQCSLTGVSSVSPVSPGPCGLAVIRDEDTSPHPAAARCNRRKAGRHQRRGERRTVRTATSSCGPPRPANARASSCRACGSSVGERPTYFDRRSSTG